MSEIYNPELYVTHGDIQTEIRARFPGFIQKLYNEKHTYKQLFDAFDNLLNDGVDVGNQFIAPFMSTHVMGLIAFAKTMKEHPDKNYLTWIYLNHLFSMILEGSCYSFYNLPEQDIGQY
jgi:hypothetical protein